MTVLAGSDAFAGSEVHLAALLAMLALQHSTKKQP